jgi:SAM-dependent methyltransferase
MRRLLSAVARTLLTERQRQNVQSWLLARRERQRYRFSVAPLPGAVPPWTDVTIVEDDELTSHIFMSGTAGEIRRGIRRLPALLYSRRKRATWALVHGSILARVLPRRDGPLDLLLIGYGMDTWDAQYLLADGQKLRITAVDVADPDLNSRYWRAVADQAEARYLQADARRLEDALAGETFDAVSICRGSIDLLSPADLLSVWEQCLALLAPGGILLAPVKGVELSQRKAAAIAAHLERGAPLEDGHGYHTQIGEFSLPVFAYGAYIPPPECLAAPALLEEMLGAATDFIGRHNLAAYQPLLARLSGPPRAGLRCLATHDGQITPSLDLNRLSRLFEVAALDYMTSDAVDNPFFTCRTTILCHKAKQAEDR